MTKLVSVSYNCVPLHDQDKNKPVLKNNFIIPTSEVCKTFSGKKRMQECYTKGQ